MATSRASCGPFRAMKLLGFPAYYSKISRGRANSPARLQLVCVVPLEVDGAKAQRPQWRLDRTPILSSLAAPTRTAQKGLDAALKRAERFLRLGADGIFVAGLTTPEDYRPGWQSLQRRLELRRNLRGGSDAVAYAGRTPQYGIFASRLSEHPYRARGEGDRESACSAWPNLAAGKRRCLQRVASRKWRLKSPGRCARFAKWKDSGKEILVRPSRMMKPCGRSRAARRVHARCEHDQQERHRHDQINVVQADRVHQQIAAVRVARRTFHRARSRSASARSRRECR